MNKLVKIAVCEDSQRDCNKLIQMIAEYLDNYNLYAEVDAFISGEAFLDSDILSYSLIFLDIFMDKLNGMETAKKLISKHKSVQIIFCSTSHEFAAESYDVSALYYMIKPIEKEKLFCVLDKFFDNILHLKTIKIKVGRIEDYIYLNDIIWAEAQNKKTVLHTKQGNIVASMPFSYFCEELLEPDFVQIIRYALVSVSQIVGIPSNKVSLTDGTVLSISRSKRSHVYEVFTEYKWKVSFQRK